MNKLPITAFIASCNEAHLLEKCLNALRFCKSIVVFDLESSDNTEEVAKQFGCKVIQHQRIPYIELIEPQFLEICQTDWMMLLDPDEVLQIGCEVFLQQEFSKLDEDKNIGAINFPWQFYFKSHQLKGTHWGGNNSKAILIRKSAVEFNGRVHSGISIKKEFTSFNVKRKENLFIAHYWMSSYQTLFEKHMRYFDGTGEFQYHSGKRTNLLNILMAPVVGGLESFFIKEGFRDGFVGLFLAFFNSWLNTGLHLTLYRYQKMKS